MSEPETNAQDPSMSTKCDRVDNEAAVECDEEKTRKMEPPPSKKRKLITEYIKRPIDILTYYPTNLEWKKIKRENLDLDYACIFPPKIANLIFNRLESEVEYLTGDFARAKFYGKWYPIPRQHVAYGDEGLVYSFAGVSLPTKQWSPLLLHLQNCVERLCGHRFNFVLINRYADGSRYLNYHRDNEHELDKNKPIVSLSFGAQRDFLLKPFDFKADIITISLENGSYLAMNPPTNKSWLHSLPLRKRVTTPRINLTFRTILKKK